MKSPKTTNPPIIRIEPTTIRIIAQTGSGREYLKI